MYISDTIFTTFLPYTLLRNNSSLPNFPFLVQLFPFPVFPSSLAGAFEGRDFEQAPFAERLQHLMLNSKGSANLKQKWSNLCRARKATKQERYKRGTETQYNFIK